MSAEDWWALIIGVAPFVGFLLVSLWAMLDAPVRAPWDRPMAVAVLSSTHFLVVWACIWDYSDFFEGGVSIVSAIALLVLTFPLVWLLQELSVSDPSGFIFVLAVALNSLLWGVALDRLTRKFSSLVRLARYRYAEQRRSGS